MSTQLCAWRSDNPSVVLRLAWVSLSLQYFHRKEGSCCLCLWGCVCAPSHMPAQVLCRPHNSSVRSLWLWGLLPTLEIGWDCGSGSGLQQLQWITQWKTASCRIAGSRLKQCSGALISIRISRELKACVAPLSLNCCFSLKQKRFHSHSDWAWCGKAVGGER